MTGSWPNRSWHTGVRQYFEETLYFFRLSLSRSSLDAFKERLLEVEHDQNVHGLNAYIVFGPYDIIIRAWLHTKAVESFAQQLYIQLGLDHTPDYFQVSFPKFHPSNQQKEMLERLGTIGNWLSVSKVTRSPNFSMS